MKYQIVGPRILLRVKKFKIEDVLKDKKYANGSNLILAPERESREEALEQAIISQTIGEVEQIGESVTRTYEGLETLKVGDKVHFVRHGAMRIGVKDATEYESWIITGKDILCIELNDKEETTCQN